MKNKTPTNILAVLMACLSLLLTACDGGLFGTGDGHDNMMVNGADGGATGETAGPTNSGETSMGLSTAAFDNMQAGGQSPTPQIRVINLTSVGVQVAANDSVAIAELASDQDSGRIDIPIDTSRLVFSDVALLTADNTSAVHTIEPFNAAAFSISTLIIRNDKNNAIDVVALSTQTEPTSADMALVRLVQNTPLGDAAATDTITLEAVEPNNSGSDVSFIGLSYENQSTAYLDVVPGSYVLSDASSRFASESISIVAGRVYSILINGIDAPSIRTIDDSQ